MSSALLLLLLLLLHHCQLIIQVLATMTQLNKVGQQLSEMQGVHAMTDVTGFGLAGHLLEMARGSGVAACVDFGKVCVLRCANARRCSLSRQMCTCRYSCHTYACIVQAVSFPAEKILICLTALSVNVARGQAWERGRRKKTRITFRHKHMLLLQCLIARGGVAKLCRALRLKCHFTVC
jgi:hypothetical protein